MKSKFKKIQLLSILMTVFAATYSAAVSAGSLQQGCSDARTKLQQARLYISANREKMTSVERESIEEDQALAQENVNILCSGMESENQN